jgi:hypothetical protein
MAGCTLNINRYTDGPLTGYLDEPVPQLSAPLARTLSLERVTYNTASGDAGTMISDLTAREIYILPSAVGREVGRILKLDDSFDPTATVAALNKIAEKRSEARAAGTIRKLGTFRDVDPAESTASSRRQQALAAEAYARGDHVEGDIRSAAAGAFLKTRQPYMATQQDQSLAYNVVGLAGAAGQAMVKSEFETLRVWLERSSGAIAETAPAGSHLSVFFLSYFDAKRFQLDSRVRVAVYLVLTDASGEMRRVMEGSDVLVCEDQCDLFAPKPSARYYDETALANETQELVSSYAGMRKLETMGFVNPGGNYQYLLLTHGLQKLAESQR